MLAAVYIILVMDICCEAQQYARIRLEHDTSKRGINQSERGEFLYWHNFYRRQVENPEAADMIYLLYHRELELAALNWATECNFNHGHFNFTRYQLDRHIGVGQNIAARIGGYNIQKAVFSWFNEGKDYTYANGSCAPGAKCGHYIQVACASVTHIGCAVVYCQQYTGSRIVKEDAYNIVCDYYPSGRRVKYVQRANVLVLEYPKLYEAGKPCTACPQEYKICEDKLCRSSPPCHTLDNTCINPRNTTTCLCDELQSSSEDELMHDSEIAANTSTTLTSENQAATTTLTSENQAATTMTQQITKVFLLTFASFLIAMLDFI